MAGKGFDPRNHSFSSANIGKNLELAKLAH